MTAGSPLTAAAKDAISILRGTRDASKEERYAVALRLAQALGVDVWTLERPSTPADPALQEWGHIDGFDSPRPKHG